jgi:hypothetical protein
LKGETVKKEERRKLKLKPAEQDEDFDWRTAVQEVEDQKAQEHDEAMAELYDLYEGEDDGEDPRPEDNPVLPI